MKALDPTSIGGIQLSRSCRQKEEVAFDEVHPLPNFDPSLFVPGHLHKILTTLDPQGRS
jgi:hypothetical protein